MPNFTPPYPSQSDWMASTPAGRRVAIITRTRDRNLLLGRALSSVLGQSHADWHLYLVNDGGDAQAVEATLAPHRAAFADRLTVIHNPVSLGIEGASNRALAQAEGDFLVIHDDDDSWHPDFLKETVGFLTREENRRYAGVVTQLVWVSERLDPDGVVEIHRELWSEWRPHVDGALLLTDNTIVPISFVVRMAVVRQIGTYNDQMPVQGDWDFNLRVFAAGDIGTIEQPLAYYHVRRGTTGSYGNTIDAGLALHLRYGVLYRNALLRAHINADPEAAGSLMALLRVIGNNHGVVMRALASSETTLAGELSGQKATLLQHLGDGQAAVTGALADTRSAMIREIGHARAVLAEGQGALADSHTTLADSHAALARALADHQAALLPRLEAIASAQAGLAARLDTIETRLAGLGLRGWWRKWWGRLRAGE